MQQIHFVQRIVSSFEKRFRSEEEIFTKAFCKGDFDLVEKIMDEHPDYAENYIKKTYIGQTGVGKSMLVVSVMRQAPESFISKLLSCGAKSDIREYENRDEISFREMLEADSFVCSLRTYSDDIIRKCIPESERGLKMCLKSALKTGNDGLTRFILEQIVEKGRPGSEVADILEFAISRENVDVVKRIVETITGKYADILSDDAFTTYDRQHNVLGNLLVSVAFHCEEASADMVKILLEHGCPLYGPSNMENVDGIARFLSLGLDNPHFVKAIIDAGYDFSRTFVSTYGQKRTILPFLLPSGRTMLSFPNPSAYLPKDTVFPVVAELKKLAKTNASFAAMLAKDAADIVTFRSGAFTKRECVEQSETEAEILDEMYAETTEFANK